MSTLQTAREDELTAPLVLVVDDVPKNVQLLGKMLAEEGYRVAAAMDGEHALQSAELNRPDLILLDVMMPGLDGYEVCRRLRASEPLSGIPVIFLTARNSVEDVVAGFDAGAVDFVSKPFQIREVLARVRTQLQLKRAQDVIRRYNEELQELLETRTRHLLESERQAAFGLLVQGIVHNLRSPLLVARAGAETIDLMLGRDAAESGSPPEGSDPVDGARKAAHSIVGACDTLNKMITSLMTKSRRDKSDALEVVDLNALVSSEIEFLQADLFFKHQVKKTIRLSAEPLNIEVVPAEISQVFQNLVRNALDALYQRMDPTLEVVTQRSGSNAEFIVADNGHGIPAENLTRIFDPFFTTKERADSGEGPVGTGLGLYMCMQTIRSYDGSIHVDSEPEKGTTFTISLKLAKAE